MSWVETLNGMNKDKLSRQRWIEIKGFEVSTYNDAL